MFKSNFWVRLTHWEFWSMNVVYIPIVTYFAWLALKARNIFFFSAANPNIETGGLFGASKYRQLAFLPTHLKPKTVLVAPNIMLPQIVELLAQANIQFPCIAKPDKAERGIGVALLYNDSDLANYLDCNKTDFVIQSYIDYPFEAGVFVYRLPEAAAFSIPSIVIKEFLSVEGDGSSSINDLIQANFRARLVADRLAQKLGDRLREIPTLGQTVLLEPIGNHNRGTKFINGNNHISPELEAIFTEICAYLPDFHYGRLDLRAPSLAHFLRGDDIKIVEVNGVNAEPAHIYDPATPPLTAWRALLYHWSIIYDISRNNIKKGVKPMTFDEAMVHYRAWQAAI